MPSDDMVGSARSEGSGALPHSGAFFLEDHGTQAAEFVAVFVAEFIEPGVGLRFELWLHRLQQLKSLRSDVSDCLPLVRTSAGATDQALGLQAVDEASYVGGTFDHAVCDLAAGMPLGMHSSQDAQDVVLGAGESIALADFVDKVVEGAGRHCEAENRFLLGIREVGLF